MFCSSIENVKQFDMYLLFIFIDNTIYIIEIVVDSILYIFLLFLFTIGRFFVSAGENVIIPIVSIIPIIIFVILFSVIIFINNGIPINIIVDETRHIQLFVACNPNEGILMMLYIRRNIIYSFIIPNIIAIVVIMISFDSVRYSPSNPYFISASFVLS